MLWNNPGHEYDAFVEGVLSNTLQIWFWGAANLGRDYLMMYSHLFRVYGIVDGNPDRIGQQVEYLTVECTDSIPSANERTIVVITCSFYDEIRPELEKKGYTHNKNLFSYQIFRRIMDVYLNRFLFSDRVDISLTEKCNFRCEKCNIFTPYFKNPQHQDKEQVKADIDAYFSIVDSVWEVNLLGGEPFLYPNFDEIIAYIGLRYQKRIKYPTIFTNGSIIPKEETIALLRQFGFRLHISLYPNVVEYQKKLPEFLETLADNDIHFKLLLNDIWADFGFPDNPNTMQDATELIPFFDTCCPPFRGLWKKHLYFCHLETSAIRAGMYPDDRDDYFDLADSTVDLRDLKKRFMEFDMGYLPQGYVTFCKVCRGRDCVNGLKVPAAAQMFR